MKNLDKWNFYMKDMASPDRYITCGFYYMIAAALQRRVWFGADKSPIFPNVYIVLVGDPGVGKGLVLKQVESILRYHKMVKGQTLLGDYKPESDEDKKTLAFEQAKNTAKDLQKEEELLLIPVAPDATTLEKLINSMASSVRAYCYRKEGADGSKLGHGVHSSLCFCLEEMSTLFKTRTHDLVNFFLKTYDCGDYRYETIARKLDMIKNCCLSLLAGTTPAFIQRSFNMDLLSEGFSARCWFIFASKNRKNMLFIENFSPEQEQARKDIIAHIKKLSTLHGEAKLAPDAREFMLSWWDDFNNKEKPNKSPKMVYYYSRMGLHAMKLAMLVHYADSLNNVITLDECKEAIALLEDWGRDMHLALCAGDKNPLGKLSVDIVKYLKGNPGSSRKELCVQFYEQLPNGTKDLDLVLHDLRTMNKITTNEKGNWMTV